MLPADLPLPVPRWLRRLLHFVLGEAFLGFLAIAAVGLTLIQLWFDVSPTTERLLETCQWGIVALFACEYMAGFSAARERKAFLLDPWRLLDLFTIVVPLLTVLPQVSHALRSSPVLRLARVIRVVVMGARASGVIMREEKRLSPVAAVVPVAVSKLEPHAAAEPRQASWTEFLQWVKTPGGDEWYHVANLGADGLAEIAISLGLPASQLEAHLFATGYPHLESTPTLAMMFVWLPEQAGDAFEVNRTGLLLLTTKRAVLTLSCAQSGLLQLVQESLPPLGPDPVPFPVQMTHALLRALLKRNEAIVGRFERELHALEAVPVRESRAQFLEHTFRLKKEFATAQADLWRLKGLIAGIAESRLTLPASVSSSPALFQGLLDEVNYLYETVVNTKEGLLSVIDLHLNVVSFEMNRVMRVLAVVSVLGLIPAVIGGLFGMNLNGNPWPFTLAQVTFAVCSGMVVCLYLFFVKGWLR